MRYLRRRRKVWALAVVMSALVATAACSDDDEAVLDTVDSDTPSGDDGGTATTEPASDASDSGGETKADGSEADPPALLLILDASGSMNSTDAQGQALLDGAKQALRQLIETLPDNQHVGLRVYGHTYPNTAPREQACADTELIHPVEPLDRQGLLTAIDNFQASGYTPIGRSLQEGAEDLPPEGRRTIVLVSDGIDTCAPPDPCQVADELSGQGVDLVVNTVGFALDQAAGEDAEAAREQLQCIADAGNGTFVDAANATELSESLDDVAREDRSFEADGGELVGAPVPADAQTGEPDTPYTDTVLETEINYYRFEVPPGSEVQGEITTVPNTSADEACGSLFPYVDLTDQSDKSWLPGLSTTVDDPGVAIVNHTPPAVLERLGEEYDEVWLKVETSRTTDGCGDQFGIELQLTVLD